ncbi:MAG: PDZ domain-containing protein [Blastochloris sp.]|nr:PDZ domain-containing protein [Blastochloris sp.]
MKIPSLAPILLLLACLNFFHACSPSDPKTTSPSTDHPSIVRVNATCQIVDPVRPWLKRPPFTRRAIGTVLSGQRILVTAEMVAHANFIELEKPVTSTKTTAYVDVIDYETNLALLRVNPEDAPTFFQDTRPLELSTTAKAGDSLEIWQLEDNDALARSTGRINTVEVGPYPEGLGRYLVYRLNLSLQYRDSAATLPAVQNGNLVGLLFRYDSRNQNAAVIAAPVIEHFLKDAADGNYQGFPRIGLGFFNLRDPQLQNYVGVTPEQGGIFINRVLPDGPGAQAGLQVGDVLLSINGIRVDQDGNYPDKTHGRLSLEHLIAGQHYVGDVLKLNLQRQGKPLDVQVTLSRKNASDYISPPYSYDEPPRYLVYGGLVFLELSRTLLKTFGNDWVSTAPQKLVYYDAFQEELFPGESRRIILVGPGPTHRRHPQLRASGRKHRPPSQRRRNQKPGRHQPRPDRPPRPPRPYRLRRRPRHHLPRPASGFHRNPRTPKKLRHFRTRTPQMIYH